MYTKALFVFYNANVARGGIRPIIFITTITHLYYLMQ